MSDHHIYELRDVLVPVRSERWTGPNFERETLPVEVASCDGDSVAFALATLREEEQIADDSKIGILYRPDDDGPGVWLINPWAKGRRQR